MKKCLKVLALIARSFPCEWRRNSSRVFDFLDSFTFTHLYSLSEMEVFGVMFRLFRSAWNIHIQPRYKIKWSLKLQRKWRKQSHYFHRDRVVLLNQLASITEFATLISIHTLVRVLWPKRHVRRYRYLQHLSLIKVHKRLAAVVPSSNHISSILSIRHVCVLSWNDLPFRFN